VRRSRAGISLACQGVVQERLEELENELKDQKQRDLEHLNLEIERLRATADTAMESFRNELDDQSTIARDENAHLRDELLELRPLTFMGETRYRELKSRWGQVFRADMGAEAFYDILKRLDLDKLAEELWLEVRTSKSKQKRKKATKRLKVVEAFRRSGNRPEWMVLDRSAGHPPRSAPHGPTGRWSFCYFRPERPVPARDQPQQSPEALARAGRPGRNRAQREAHAPGSCRFTDR
jgi:DNA-directed RNA polymerase subunit beta'